MKGTPNQLIDDLFLDSIVIPGHTDLYTCNNKSGFDKLISYSFPIPSNLQSTEETNQKFELDVTPLNKNSQYEKSTSSLNSSDSELKGRFKVSHHYKGIPNHNSKVFRIKHISKGNNHILPKPKHKFSISVEIPKRNFKRSVSKDNYDDLIDIF